MVYMLSYVVTASVCLLAFALNVDHTFSSSVLADNLPLNQPPQCSDPNQMLVSVGNDTWMCDCGPGFIYYEPKDACFLPYREGPCPKGHHLVYSTEKRNTLCKKNPCEDGFARYNNMCYELGKTGPCRKTKNGTGIFDVNSTTLEIGCIGGIEILFLFDIPKMCPPGSKRDSKGDCREQF